MAEKNPHPFLTIGQENKGPSIVRRMTELEEAETVGVAPEEKEISKHEAYALVGHVTKQLMQEVQKTMGNDQIREINAARIINEACQALEYRNGQFAVNRDWPPHSLIVDSVWHLQEFLHYFINDILAGDIGEFNDKSPAFQRLDYAVKQRHDKWNHSGGVYKNAQDLIRSGVGTAVKETWILMNAIPRVFYKKFGRDITEVEFDELLRDGGELLLKVASFRVDMIHRPSSIEIKYGAAGMAAAELRYEIQETDQGLSLDFKKEYLDDRWHTYKEKLQEDLDLEEYIKATGHYEEIPEDFQAPGPEPRHGCPVRDIRLPDKQGKLVSGIQAVFDFYVPLAKQVILPNQKILRGEKTI